VAYDAAGNASAASTAVSVTTPDTIAPATPTALTAAAASFTQVDVSWGTATDAGGSGLAGYRLYRNGNLIKTTAATSFSDTGLAQGTTYSYAIAAYDGANNQSALSSDVKVLTPSPLGATISATTWDYIAQVGQPTSISPSVVVTATGGAGGYTYAWQRVSGDTETTVNNATSSTTGWFRTIPSFHIYYRSVWRCEVKDSAGTVVYTSNVTVSFIKENQD
jgi:fibronectin type 3 domain-containing protein